MPRPFRRKADVDGQLGSKPGVTGHIWIDILAQRTAPTARGWRSGPAIPGSTYENQEKVADCRRKSCLQTFRRSRHGEANCYQGKRFIAATDFSLYQKILGTIGIEH